jgi:predicted ATPase/DNA-binding SARP family transcriptional activator/DNA-binding CsgD family transcriptional regulator
MLGAFRVYVGTRQIGAADWQRKVRRLLALIALAPDHRLHREQVVEALWPDSDLADAGNVLNRTLYTARRVLEPDLTPGRPSAYVQVHDDVLILTSPQRLWIDVDAFKAAATMARRARTPAAYHAALNLYGGELLPDDRYEDWAASPREELRDQYLARLLETAHLHEERGELEEAVQTLGRALAQEPAQEEAHVDLMRLYARQGRQDAALRQYERLAEALQRELYATPTVASRRLRDQIAAGRFPAAPASTTTPPVPDVWPSTLPAPTTTFIGRERELSDVIGLLSSARLLTLTGAGGTGKTRLALHAAAAVQRAYSDGVRVVELAAVADGALVSQAVATALQVREEPGRPIMATLLEALRERRLLLVLDNCEHLCSACAELAAALLSSCSHVRLLATSREPLGLGEELPWPVPALALPEPGQPITAERVIEYDAVSLFLERARLMRPTFTLTADNAAAVALLCRRLDGMPLGIELAAARVTVLTPQEMADRLDDIFALLPEHRDPHLPHHRTLRAAIDWSHMLLAEEERVLFRRLAVFAGGWTMEAAEAVCSGGGIVRGAILDLLARLVEQSLVVTREQEGAMRFSQLETIRQYAAEKLELAGEADSLRRCHAGWCMTVSEAAVEAVKGPEQAKWFSLLETEHDNLRAALRWAIEVENAEVGLRTGGSLWRFWYAHGYVSEGRDTLERLLALPCDDRETEARGNALVGAGVLAWKLGDYQRATALLDQCLVLFHRLGHKRGMAMALGNLGTVASKQGNLSLAADLYEQSLTLRREIEDRWGIANALHSLAHIVQRQGGYERAIGLYEEALALARQLGDTWSVAAYLNNLGSALLDQGNLTRAALLYDEDLALFRQLGDTLSTAISIGSLGDIARRRGEFVRAQALYGEVLPLLRELGHRDGVAALLTSLGEISLRQGDSGTATAQVHESLVLYKELGDKAGIVACLEMLGHIALIQKQAERAVPLWSAAHAIRDSLGISLAPADQAAHEDGLSAARSALGPAAFTRAWDTGHAATLEQAMLAGLTAHPFGEAVHATSTSDGEAAPSRLPTAPACRSARSTQLTARERQIAALIAAGQTNRQIAAATGIALRTVDTHVGKILGKLGVSTRAAVALALVEQRVEQETQHREATT